MSTKIKVKNILIVKQHNQLGDMLCTFPLFFALKKKYPDSHITLIASPDNCRILNPDNIINDILVYDKFSVKELIKFYSKLRRRKYDLGIVPSTVSFSRTSHYLNYISGAKLRVGAEGINGKINKSSNLLHIKKKFEWIDDFHQTEKNIDIVRQIGCDMKKEEISNITINLSTKEKDSAKKFFHINFPDKSKKVFAFHTGAGKPQNRWDKKKFVELIIKLKNNFDSYIFLSSGKMDTDITDYISKKLLSEGISYVTEKDIPIREMGAILSLTDLFITNDTGPMHVAAFTNSTVIGLFGPTKGTEWGPLNPKGTYIQSPSDNINDISVEDVFKLAISKIINKETEKNNG